MMFICKHLDDLAGIAEKILDIFSEERVFIFKGELGVGKTTLIKAICNKLHVNVPTNSPSFAIVNEYKTNNHLKLFHFDFYRIKKLDEVFDIGYEEYFFSNNYCFIEWPEIIEEILPEHYVEIQIELESKNNSRRISLTKKSY
jgi:tRNA threonylcarbamoyladenosine biosynthesis protein TsaE